MRKVVALGPVFIICLILGATAAAFGQAPSCGVADDGQIHTPPNYTCSGGGSPTPCSQPVAGIVAPLAPPAAAGGTITDPQYGCTIKRMGQIGAIPGLGSTQSGHHYYSTQSPFDASDTYFMGYSDSGSYYIQNASTGAYVINASAMPNIGGAPHDIVWDPVLTGTFYAGQGNTFVKYVVSGSSLTSTVLHTFSGYSTCFVPDQEGLSVDNPTLVWLVCDTTAILYNDSTNTVISSSLSVGNYGGSPGWHKIQIMPSGKMLMTWEGSPSGQGPEVLFNTDGSLYWDPKFEYSNHTATGYDLSGHEVIIAQASGVANLNGCANAWTQLSIIDINAETAIGCLTPHVVPNYEISYEMSAQGGGWVLLTSCQAGCGGSTAAPTPYSFDTVSPTRLSSGWASAWQLYDEEAFVCKIDGSGCYRLAHMRSRDAENYWAIPRGAESFSGNYIAFDSNFDISNTGQSQYSDSYTIQIQSGGTSAPPAPAAPTNLSATVSQ
jgi:hypothetical protein